MKGANCVRTGTVSALYLGEWLCSACVCMHGVWVLAVGVRPQPRGHCPTGVPAPGETRVYAPFLGDLCVSACVCAGGALNSRSWSGAVACKAAREAGDPGPATAETACLRSFTRRGRGPWSGHLHAFHSDECSVPIGNTCSVLLLGGSGDTERQQPCICRATCSAALNTGAIQ